MKGVSLPVLSVAMVALFTFLLVPRNVSDPDIWWHIHNAQVQWSLHGVLRHDIYSFTAAGSSWMNHEWLSEIPFAIGWKLGGALGVYLVTLSAVMTVMMLMLRAAWTATKNPVAAVLAMLPAIFLSSVSFGPRTLLFGWMLLLAELAVLDRFRQGNNRALWWLPPIFAVWVNTHGSWMIGLALFAAFAIAGLFEFQAGGLFATRWTRAQRSLLAKCGGASIAALFLNPYGWRLVLYPFDMAFRQKLNVASVEEWRSVDFHLVRGKIFLAVMVLLLVFRLLQRTRWTLAETLFALIALDAGLTYSRFLFLAAILLTPLMARDIAAWMPTRSFGNKRLLYNVAFACCCWLMFRQFPARAAVADLPDYPVQATVWLQHHPLQGKTFNEYLWGGYLIQHVPQMKTFIDSRVDIFEYNGTLRDYLDTAHLENSLALLDKYQIVNVFISAKSPLAYFLLHTQGWHVAYKDNVAILFERN